MNFLALPCLLCALLAPAVSRSDDPAKDLDKLQGTWSLASMEAEGKKVPDAELKGVTAVFAKDRMTVGKGDDTETAVLKIDSTKKPKWIDTTSKDGEKLQGIYELDGDNLKICLSKKENDRPTEFATKAGIEHGFLVFKRQK